MSTSGGSTVTSPGRTLYRMLAGQGDPGFLQFQFRYDGTDLPPDHPLHAPASWCGPTFVPTGQVRTVARLFRQQDCSVGAVPRRQPEEGYMGGAWVLWARLETGKHAEALARLRTGPTLVLREGKSPRRVALWALAEPLNMVWLERANRRIAHQLGTKKKFAAAEFALHPAGTTLSLGAKPAPVWAEHMDPGALYRAREVVGALRDAPEPIDWRRAA